ncbi:24323_t:CDS:1 [Racocetra persica]|uniref:24323_t:CDS:1 n=1 Tax=Racocetra persica TaxID=160502 RepID=A0ACA9SFM0_9GLOM|nr:24323_t:CDS:1 [Racocetra persica]
MIPIINPVTNGATNQASRLTHDLSRTIIPDATTTVPAIGTTTSSTGLHTSSINMQLAPLVSGTTTSSAGLHTSSTNIPSTNMQSVPFAPNAWLRDGSPIQVKVPHAKYRTTTFATPMMTNERSVSIKKRVHGGMPPDPDPDEGIEY